MSSAQAKVGEDALLCVPMQLVDESKGDAYGSIQEVAPGEPLSQETKRHIRWLVCVLLFVDYSLMTMVMPVLPHALQNQVAAADTSVCCCY